MSDLNLATAFPQDTDTERLLLARLGIRSGMRFRSTTLTTGLASAARTASTATADITGAGARGVFAVLQTTTTDATLNLNLGVTLTIAGQPYVLAASGNFGVASTLYRTLLLHPTFSTGATTMSGYAWNGNNFQGSLPETFRLAVSHSSANTITYSLSYILLD